MKNKFVVQFGEVNNVIGALTLAIEKNKPITYDSDKDVYIIDGLEVTPHFFAETTAKFAHYINIVNRVILKAHEKPSPDEENGD